MKAKRSCAQVVALRPSTNSETANRNIQLLPTPCRSVPRIVRGASSSLAARTACVITLCRLGRSRAHFSDVPPHLKARDEFGIAPNPANFYRAHALCLVGGRKTLPRSSSVDRVLPPHSERTTPCSAPDTRPQFPTRDSLLDIKSRNGISYHQ